jgi:hypothetical protein
MVTTARPSGAPSSTCVERALTPELYPLPPPFRPLRLIFIFCQEAILKTKVMTPDNTPLTRQNTERNLACFDAPFGILKIEGIF